LASAACHDRRRRHEMDLIQGGLREGGPPLWDGCRVQWHDAVSLRSVTHIGGTPCAGCGSTTAPADTLAGRVDPKPGAMTTASREKRTRSGHRYTVREEVPAWPMARLSLTRCLACGHETVYDMETDQLWDLDDSD